MKVNSLSVNLLVNALVEPGQPFSIPDLYFDANPFHSLANTVVPAVVLFSSMLGIALIGVEHRDRGVHDVGADAEDHGRAASRRTKKKMATTNELVMAAISLQALIRHQYQRRMNTSPVPAPMARSRQTTTANSVAPSIIAAAVLLCAG